MKVLLNILWTLLIFVSLDLHSQNFYPKEYQKLAQISNESEWQIVNNNLTKAKQLYDSLFTKTGYNPSARDLWNRAMLASNMNDTEIKDSIVGVLIEKGYDIDKLTKCFPESVEKIPLDKSYYETIESHHEFVNELVKVDQSANSKKNENPELLVQTALDNIDKLMHYQNRVDSLNLKYFSIETAGLGVCILHYFQLVNNQNVDTSKIENPPHYLGYLKEVDFNLEVLTNFLKDQVIKGNYARQDLADMRFIVDHIDQIIIHQFNNYVFIATPEYQEKTENIQRINELRENYGLSNFYRYFARVKFIDSLRMNSDINEPIHREAIPTYIEKLSSCSYNFTSQYRFILFFKKDEEAYKVYNRYIEKQ